VSKSVGIKLREQTIEALNTKKNKSEFISNTLLKYQGFCPLCHQSFPKRQFKKNDGGRLSDDAEEIFEGIEARYTYLSNMLDVELGFCPICGNKQDNSQA
jgi:uncharacterized protein (DUF2225 family)